MDTEDTHCLYLYNIPDTEKENIHFSVKDESIVELKNVDLCDDRNGLIEAHVKFLSEGETEITATLNYNGKEYSDTLKIRVFESRYSLELSTKNKEEIPNQIEKGQQLQLMAELIDNTSNSRYPDISTTTTWKSNNEEVAKIDNDGKLTAIEVGKATITAEYDNNGEKIQESFEITVKNQNMPTVTGIWFGRSIPGHVAILNEKHAYNIELFNISDTVKRNIQVSVKDENIAKLENIDYCDSGDNNLPGMIYANVKFVGVGKTEITATLIGDGGGNEYSDTLEIYVFESEYSLKLSANDKEEMPTQIEKGQQLQLKAELVENGTYFAPADVTSNGTTWKSNNEKVVKVDSKGLLTAIESGKATITAEYDKDGEKVTASFEINVKETDKPTELTVKFPNYITKEKDGKKYITKIKTKTSIENFKKNIETNGNIAIKQGNTTISDNNKLIVTGMKMIISLNDKSQEFIIAIKGDATGDGVSDMSDILRINKHRLHKSEDVLLLGEYFLAGDVNEDNNVDMSDIMQVNKHRLGKASIID